MLPLEWINVVDEYPPDFWGVYVLNGKKIYWGQYTGQYWETVGRGDFGLDNIKLHKVTKWSQNPRTKLAIPLKELMEFKKKAKEYSKTKLNFNIRFHNIRLY